MNDLLYDDITREEEGDGDRDEKEDVGPAGLWSRAHELRVVDTEQQAQREKGQQHSVKDLAKVFKR